MRLNQVFDCGGGYDITDHRYLTVMSHWSNLTNTIVAVYGYQTTGFRLKLYDNEAGI